MEKENVKNDNNGNQHRELSYDELKNIAIQLQSKNSEMESIINNMSTGYDLKRIDFLFQIINNDSFSHNTRSKAVDLVTELILGPENKCQCENDKCANEDSCCQSPDCN